MERALNHWDLPFACPYGLVTVGLHCAVAATEWHLHATNNYANANANANGGAECIDPRLDARSKPTAVAALSG